MTERVPPPAPPGNPSASQYLFGVLRNIGSFGLGVPGGNNPIGNNIGGEEKTAATGDRRALVRQDALGIDYNADGKGIGFNTPSLLGIFQLPPYYHNGACETLVCVVGNQSGTARPTSPGRTSSGTRQTSPASCDSWRPSAPTRARCPSGAADAMSTGAQYVVAAYGVVLFGLVMYLVAVGASARSSAADCRAVARETGAPDAQPARPSQGAAARPDPRPVEAP